MHIEHVQFLPNQDFKFNRKAVRVSTFLIERGKIFQRRLALKIKEFTPCVIVLAVGSESVFPVLRLY